MLALSACGGSSSNAAPPDAVAKAATATSAKGSEHFTLTGSVQALGQSIPLSGGGDFKNLPRPGEGTMTISVDIGGNKAPVTAVFAGSTVYLSSSLFAATLPKGKTWIKIDTRKAATFSGIDLNQLSANNPSEILSALEKTSTVTKAGTDTIGGIKATHYRVTANGQPADVWVGPDNTLVRVTENVKVASATSSTTVDFSRYGEPVVVKVPKASQTVDISKLGG
ncbi:MAG TPA: hypothetical protein VGL84_00840 [Gaiellaceae bacterium]